MVAPPQPEAPPQSELSISGEASTEEAAAIVAALERFLDETAPSRGSRGEDSPNPWMRAAMLEGVSREDHGDVPHPWINT